MSAYDPVGTARTAIANASRIVVLTGTGISTDSGIPDFRGPEGVWTKDPDAEMLSSFDVWVSDPEVRRRAWASRLTSPFAVAAPNRGHRAITTIDESGRLELLVTQNIDRLHHRAGTSPDRIVEIHGNAHESVCLECGDHQPIDATLARVEAGDPEPLCEAIVDGHACGGMLKSATISFGQALIAEDLERAQLAAASCDLLLAVGSTLSVYPVAGLVPLAGASGATLIIVNGDPTAMDGLADLVLHADISTTLDELVEGLPDLPG